jgi:putative membrane protein
VEATKEGKAIMRRNLGLSLVLAGASFCFIGATPAVAQAQSTTPQSGGAPMGERPGAGSPNAPATAPQEAQMPQPASGASQSSSKMSDQKFVEEAANGGMMEVAVGHLAQQKSSNDAVKQFGEKLVQDHTKANDQLKEAASKAGITVPATLDSKHQSKVDKLSSLSGDAFDKAFAKDAVKDHEKDIKLFKKEAENATNPGIKEFASSTLPVLQEHLSMAKGLKSHKASANTGQ